MISNFTVKERVIIECTIIDSTLKTGQLAEIYGTSSLKSMIHELVLINGDFIDIVNITSNSEGEYAHSYNSKYPGTWSAQVLYPGDENRVPSESEPLFFIKNPVDIECELYEINVRGTQKAEIRGTSSLHSSSITLEFCCGSLQHTYDLTTDENGVFNFKFSPNGIGVWSVVAIFKGDEYESAASSEKVTFTYEILQTHISALLNHTSVKTGKPITISGSVAPQVEGLPVELLYVSPESSFTHTIFTNSRGTFSFTYNPEELGTWNILAKVGDDLIYTKINKLLEFEVIPLNIFDKIMNVGAMMLSPPFSYGAIGFVFVGFLSVIYIKRDQVIKRLPESLAKKMQGKKSRQKKKNKNGAQRYRRKGT